MDRWGGRFIESGVWSKNGGIDDFQQGTCSIRIGDGKSKKAKLRAEIGIKNRKQLRIQFIGGNLLHEMCDIHEEEYVKQS